MVNKIADLARRIEASIPRACVDFTEFPSGAVMLDVLTEGHLFVLSYSPTRAFEVDEVEDSEGFLLGCRFASEQFEPAAERLWELVSRAEAA